MFTARRLRPALVTATCSVLLGVPVVAGCSGASSTGAGSTGSGAASGTSPVAATSAGPSSGGAAGTGTPTGSAGNGSPAPVPPTPLGYAPADPKKVGAWVEVRSTPTGTTDEQAVLRVWRTYLQLSSEAANTQGAGASATEQAKALDAVATGNGKAAVLAVAEARRKAGTFTIGRTVLTEALVQVRGDTAAVSACVDDQSYEVDRTGRTVTPATGVQAVSGAVVRVGGGWKVTALVGGGRTCPTS